METTNVFHEIVNQLNESSKPAPNYFIHSAGTGNGFYPNYVLFSNFEVEQFHPLASISLVIPYKQKSFSLILNTLFSMITFLTTSNIFNLL